MVKANNYDQAIKELATHDEKLVSQVPEKIDSAEKNMFHVITVKVNDRPGQSRNETVQNVQKYHETGFEKLKKNFPIMGFSTLIVLHDPNKGTEDAEEETVLDESSFTKSTIASKVSSELAAGTQEETEARIEEEVERRLQLKIAEQIIDKGGEVTQGKLENHDPQFVEEGEIEEVTASKKLSTEQLDEFLKTNTVKGYNEFAKENKIDVNGLTTRAQFAEAFKNWNDNQK